MRLTALVICLLLPACALCQEDYKAGWGRGRITNAAALRVGAGWNKAWFASLGVSYVQSNVNKHLPFSLVAYGAAELDRLYGPAPLQYYGGKAGLEMAFYFLAVGAELRCNTDLAGRNQVVLTPKAGLSFYGYAGFFFGYNLFDGDDNVFGIIPNQLSLSINLNRHLLKGTIFPGR